MDEQAARIAAFLAQFFTVDQGIDVLRRPSHQKAAIEMLISNEVMTAAEIRAEALSDYSVIIPYEYFPGGTA